ncbi:hypothetical protein AMAG_02688 [Allomyces macrogynus ATCC 38327]|uniref:Dol-P-Man:Man(5)GlcNAc(2)-PP-Dol alpha-1,3-mannosyltransferase n=1 Tax=Allomyces macrogynus (strain ATCC 38327) TaxID=578462 RepID=A0A0L0S2X3_ALLM3|nr:hypothetical protein AMAG_02688 [Allomyces macrogynus ATCC 38327]|eukprot:KNE56917.1 hypothetical protein AMAG_02688 [Allomyces macrogynus ATCC 38327]
MTIRRSSSCSSASSSASCRATLLPDDDAMSSTGRRPSLQTTSSSRSIMAATGDAFARVAKAADRHPYTIMAGLVALEIIFDRALIARVPYTEIDWLTYMQQVGLVLAGERDYSAISGDTGPLVYPAGHVWIYGALHGATNGGTNRILAQYLFAALHCLTLAVVMILYRVCQFPVITFPLLCLSKRLHSIYVLRLFNDPFVTLFTMASLLALTRNRTWIASTLFSLGLSVKMNALLAAPALLYQLAMRHGPLAFFAHVLLIVTIQIGVALPFLAHAPRAYLSRAFDMSRVFMHKWTVNWRFVPEPAFVSPAFALVLVSIWFALVVGMLVWWNARHQRGLPSALARWFVRGKPGAPRNVWDDARATVTLAFAVQLVGITTARSLHYQFYAWYAMALPMLVQVTDWTWPTRLAILAAIEYCWNVFPSTNFSSALLLACHLALLVGVMRGHVFTAAAAPARGRRRSARRRSIQATVRKATTTARDPAAAGPQRRMSIQKTVNVRQGSPAQ